jgi:hypothetical protein
LGEVTILYLLAEQADDPEGIGAQVGHLLLDDLVDQPNFLAYPGHDLPKINSANIFH